MVDEPEKIWIEQDDCPYFYFESELSEVSSPVTEYTRSDLVAELEAENERLKHALEAANKRADEAKALVRMLEDAETVEIMQTLRARVAIMQEVLEIIAGKRRVERGEVTALKGASHEQG